MWTCVINKQVQSRNITANHLPHSQIVEVCVNKLIHAINFSCSKYVGSCFLAGIKDVISSKTYPHSRLGQVKGTCVLIDVTELHFQLGQQTGMLGSQIL